MIPLFRFLAWLKARWYVVVIVALGFWIFHLARARPRERSAGEVTGGFEAAAPGSVVVRTTPVYIRQPSAPEALFHTAAWKRFRDEFKVVVAENKRLARALAERDETPTTVTVLQAEDAPDSMQFHYGESVEHPAVRLQVIAPETYSLLLKARAYRVGIVETEGGRWYAELEDRTMGRSLRVTDFTVRRVAPSWRPAWLRWSLGAGVASDGDASHLHAEASIAPVAWTKGTRRIEFLRLSADQYRVALDVVRIGN